MRSVVYYSFRRQRNGVGLRPVRQDRHQQCGANGARNLLDRIGDRGSVRMKRCRQLVQTGRGNGHQEQRHPETSAGGQKQEGCIAGRSGQ
ncbi:hypothetical protein D3C75_229360 [compost metagenome]